MKNECYKTMEIKKQIQLLVLQELQYYLLPFQQLTFPIDIKKGAFANSVFAVSSKLITKQSLRMVFLIL